jgi:cystathionine gamma-synthase/O-acetylhomoserine (thiol)-lyase
MLLRGLHTLPLRMARQCETANVVAAAMDGHPAITRVDHPSLPGHGSHELARRLFAKDRYGAIVTVTARDREAGMRLIDRLQLIQRATSLGGTVSKAVHVTTTTHKSLTPEALAQGRIEPGAVRISIGLEDPGDLIADLTQALAP